METRVKGKHFEVTDALRQRVQQKLGRLERYLDTVAEAQVELARESTRSATDRYVVQVTLWASGVVVRGEQKAGDVYQALDAVFDVLQERLVRFKEKHYRRTGRRRPERIGQLLAPPVEEEPEALEDEADERLSIVRVKRTPIKPMPAEEAIEQLELLGHDFYVFLDSTTERVSVLYRRRDGGYGLIQPEPA
jgi:putative sigma-54 modulation protein